LNHVLRQVKTNYDATQPERSESAEDCDWRAEEHAKRYCPAFVESCQN
jgi:hypothetical protein